jgi:hypothetical protein
MILSRPGKKHSANRSMQSLTKPDASQSSELVTSGGLVQVSPLSQLEMISQKVRRLLDTALLCLVIHMHHPEALCIAIRPLKVVQEAPRQVGTHSHSILGYRLVHAPQVPFEVVCPERVMQHVL